eukprot:456046-Prorocentrum_lima.AAC.1
MNKAVWFSPWGSGVCDAGDFHLKPPSQHLPLRADGGFYRLPVDCGARGATRDFEQLAAIAEEAYQPEHNKEKPPLMSSGFQ